MCVCVILARRSRAGLMLQWRRPDTPPLWARISLTCQIGGSVSLAVGPDSHRKYFLSIGELGTGKVRQGGRGCRWRRGGLAGPGEREREREGIITIFGQIE